MRRDEREHTGEHSSPPPEIQAFEEKVENQKKNPKAPTKKRKSTKKGKKEGEKKPEPEITLQDVLDSLPKPSANYRSIYIPKRPCEVVDIPDDIRDDPFGLFRLYFSKSTFETLAKNVNSNAEHRRKEAAEKLRSGRKQRVWQDVESTDVEIFACVLLTRGFCDCKRAEAYWNQRCDRPYFQQVLGSMTLNRYEDIKRYFHVSNFKAIQGSGPQ